MHKHTRNLFGLTTNSGYNYQLSVLAKAHNTCFICPFTASTTLPLSPLYTCRCSNKFIDTIPVQKRSKNTSFFPLSFSSNFKPTIYGTKTFTSTMYYMSNTSISSSNIKNDRREWNKKETPCQSGKY